jgi:hypothetical protein
MFDWSKMSAAHLIFIPAVLLIGMVIGWVLGGRAAADAFAMQQRRAAEREAKRKLREATEAPTEFND